MEKLEGFDFQALEFDNDGNVTKGADDLAKFVQSDGVTDVILLCHGFRNDENDARKLYRGFLSTFKKNAAAPALAASLGGRKFAVGGAFWPSMVFPEPNDSGGAQSVGSNAVHKKRLLAMKAAVSKPAQKKAIDKAIALLPKAAKDENAQLEMIRLLQSVWGAVKGDEAAGVKTLMKTDAKTIHTALVGNAGITVSTSGGSGSVGLGIPGGKPKSAAGGAQGIGSIFGFVPKFLNLTTFLLMFNRCGDVGANGLAKTVRAIRKLSPGVRIHLAGHSLGGRSVTACANSLSKSPLMNIDSMMLLQAAYSHFGLSPGGAVRPRGFFRDVIEKKVVKVPILATNSEKDSVVGVAYTAMAAVSVNNSKAAIPGANKIFGGIGRNGILGTPETVQQDLNTVGTAYSFKPGKVYNLNGTRVVGGKPMIESHGDVTNDAVTWAFASMVAGT